MFAGFSIPLPDVPKFWSWAPYISYPRYVYEGNLSNVHAIRSRMFHNTCRGPTGLVVSEFEALGYSTEETDTALDAYGKMRMC
jgi:hypothetical protein